MKAFAEIYDLEQQSICARNYKEIIDLFDNSKFTTFVLEEKHKKLMMNWQTINTYKNDR